jgi:predicted naringenin-chalcone synthase
MAEAIEAPATGATANGHRPPAVRPHIAGLALASPSESLDQQQLLTLLGLRGNGFAEDVFGRSGVQQRQLELDGPLLAATLQERTAQTEQRLLRMACDAIDQLACDPGQIGVVVSATYYSLGGPTLAHRLVEHYGLDPDTDKYHLVGIGCASAVPLLRLAAQALRAHPGKQALVVAAESVSGFLTPIELGDDRVKVVGSALFGDGCAATLLELSEHAPGPAIVDSAVHQIPGTLDHVRFAVDGDSHMAIDRELPGVAERQLPPLVDDFLERRGNEPSDIDHWLVHPGGRGIVEAVQRGLGLSDEQIAPSVRVLAEHGNVGTPSAFYVLATTEAERCPAPGDSGLMVTIGPGVTVGLMLLQW